jgi:hypothetical protein
MAMTYWLRQTGDDRNVRVIVQALAELCDETVSLAG